ncbi:beta-galactosidase [Renibacterium salmoninarum ATCC 33209]|uniref:beta-galactosidase n=2 Tax=Renibacterium salmoninarum TaxID=1646 RepID=A9WL80_RENSM|nr:beta-galactosidase [Renibacterium salmoninarum ATCC 33209]
MSSLVHRRDAGRPVHYEGDHAGAYTDVYSLMYAPVPALLSIAQDLPTQLYNCSVAESIRQRGKPFLLCEYVHAMGNGPGAIDQYEDLVWQHPRLHGGFVWEWRDHGLLTRTPAGKPFYGYGGDFGEVVHDGNFVMDGMILSDETPTPGLHEYKAVVQPILFSFDADSVRLSNLRHSADTSDLEFSWTIDRDGEQHSSGILALPQISAGDDAIVPMPPTPDATGELWLTVTAALKAPTNWAEAGHIVASAQNQIQAAVVTAVPARPLGVVMNNGVSETIRLGSAVFSHGVLTELAGLEIAGPQLQLWRAPTDNDEGASFGNYDDGDPVATGGWGKPGPAVAALWHSAGLDRLEHRLDAQEVGEGFVRTVTRSAAADSREYVRSTVLWQFVDDELVLGIDIEPSRGWTSVWPRIGVRFDLPAVIDGARWFGQGPAESYPDSMRAAAVGRFELGIDALSAGYARPQETGHRSGLRELDLLAAGQRRLSIRAFADQQGRRPGFTLFRYTAEELTAAGHPHELPTSSGSYLYLDAAQHGLGSRACGPDVWPSYTLRPEARSITLRILA